MVFLIRNVAFIWGVAILVHSLGLWLAAPSKIPSGGGLVASLGNEHGLANARPWTNQILITT